MVLLDDDELDRPVPAAAPVGPTLGAAVLRHRRRATSASSPTVDGIEYDNLFIFDEVGWNFEPSEISAAFGLVQLRKLPG